MKRSYLLAAFATLVAVPLVSPRPAVAWTGPIRDRAALEASRMMPASLRLLLERHRDDLLAGVRQPSDHERSPMHTLLEDQAAPSAASALRDATMGAIGLLDQQAPFSEVVRQLGVVAHAVGDLNDPAQVSDADPREASWRSDYAAYVESNLGTYPLVFHGWESPPLDDASRPVEQRLLDFGAATAGRARRYYRHVSAAYDPANKNPLAVRFDIRSLPYGIGSLSWSNIVTDTARVWLFVWKQAHGDLHGTPWLKSRGAPPVSAAAGADP
jgi:hypothetical protein